MLNYTGNFNTEIKNTLGRRVDIEIKFIKNDTEYTLTSDDLQEFSYQAQTEKELGGVEKKVANIRFMNNENTSLLQKGDGITIYFLTSPTSKCKFCKLYIKERKTDTKGLIISVEAVDLITYLNDKDLPIIPLQKDIFLSQYMQSLFNAIGVNHSISGAITNPKLRFAYLKSAKILSTLTEMAVASNSIIRHKVTKDKRFVTIPVQIPTFFNEVKTTYDDIINIKPFKASEPVDELTFNDLLKDISITDSDNNTYDQVLIPIFYPNDRQYNKLGSLASTIPGGVSNYSIGNISFKNLSIPQLVHFDNEVRIYDFDFSGDKCNIKVNNPNLFAIDCNIDIFGSDLSTLTVVQNSSDERVKIINNQYIQSPAVYDKQIYYSKDIDIKYRGNPLYEVGDTVIVDGNTVLIREHSLTYNGALSGSIKGVVVNE
jgi:hypothetical protein